MANLIADRTLPPEKKLALMQEDARYELDGDDRACLPDLSFLKQEIRSKAAPPTVPKVFLSNDCIFNCAYCGCRSSRDCRRYDSTPRELAQFSVEQAMQGGRGVFLTSAIYKNPDYTQELLIETLRIIRGELAFDGYVHTKVMPGASPRLIAQAGAMSNRLSVNIEVARSEGYGMIARNKNKGNILTPMGQISAMIRQSKEEKSPFAPAFATSQTTQLMAGSTGEDDSTILRLSGALYRKYGLSRVYYTAFQYQQPALGYEELPQVSTPHWRMQRLYQADRLMQLYGFSPNDITPEAAPCLRPDLDPKAAWALRNLHRFPVEINTAGYETLLQVPGIGIVYAKRILKARQYCSLSQEALRSLGVSLKRCRHFITCNGRFTGSFLDNPSLLEAALADPAAQLGLPEAEQLRLAV